MPLRILGKPHEADGSGYYRFYLPFQHLARVSDHRILLPEPGETSFTPNDDQVAELDVIVGQRFCGPHGLALWERWKNRVALVYEIDDHMMQPDTAQGLPHLFDPLVRDSFKVCIAASDMVTVSTPALAEVMSRYNPNVRVLPNFVDGDLLHMDRPHRDRVVVGWAGGQSHLHDWAHVMHPVGQVLRDHSDVDVHFVGLDYSPILELGREARYTPWVPHVWNYFKGIDFDIGLCPLADTPFNNCKSHIKALEYMALGIPVVASDRPAYRDLVIDGVTGYLVRSESEWVSRVRDLIHDAAMRSEMGAKGREVAAGWTIQQGWKLWRDAYEDVAAATVSAPPPAKPKVTSASETNVAEWRRLFLDHGAASRPHHRGMECMQYQSDMDRYAELIDELRSPFIIEIGRANGGTALYLGDEAAKYGGQVISVDIMGPIIDHPNVTYLEGSSISTQTLDEIRRLTDGQRGLVLLDGEHSTKQVRAELDVYADFADYLIVEDTIVGQLGFPVSHLDWTNGPHVAVAGWLPDHPEFEPDPDPTPTQHPGGWLRRRTS